LTSSPLKSKKLSLEAVHSPCAKKLGTDLATPPSISKPSDDELPPSVIDSSGSFKSPNKSGQSENLKSTINSSSLLNSKPAWSTSFKSTSSAFKSKTLPTETENLFTTRANNFSTSSNSTFGNNFSNFNSGGFGWLKKKSDGDKKQEKIETKEKDTNDKTVAFKHSEKPLLIGTDKIQPNLELVKTSTGEESEICILEIYAKLFQFNTTKRDWEDLGRGTLRLNDNRKFTEQNSNRHRLEIKKDASLKRSSRLIMRGSGTLRVILNTSLFPDMMATKAGPKSVKISATHHETGQVLIYLINSKPNDCDELIKSITHRLTELQNQREQQELEQKKVQETKQNVNIEGPEDGEITENATNSQNTSFSSNEVNSQASQLTIKDKLGNLEDGEVAT